MEDKKCSNKSIKHIKFFLLKILKDNMINNAILLNLSRIIIIKHIQDQVLTNIKIEILIEVTQDKMDGRMKNIDKKLCNKYLKNNKNLTIFIEIGMKVIIKI